MTTLTLDLNPEATQFIKTQAAEQKMSLEDWLLQAIGFSPTPITHEYTTDDFNEETLESIRQAERGELNRCNSLEELHKALGI